MAEAAAELGFDGVDLTVRPKGHVLPERVEDDLPRALDAMKKAGFRPGMMATNVLDPDDPEHRRVLETASGLGMQYYRTAYFRYTPGGAIPAELESFSRQLSALGELNRRLGIRGCYQNHAGNYVGAQIWEVRELLKNAAPDYMGVQYDVCHAVTEGGLSWETGLRLIRERIGTINIKDFRWTREKGKWRAEKTPVGEGMVDFTRYFRLLKQYGIRVPVCLHFEYTLGGAEHGATALSCDRKVVFDAMKRDLLTVRRLWKDA